MAEVDLSGVKEALVVRPGDKLIVRARIGITMETAADIARQLEDRLPGVSVVVVAADQMLGYRPDGANDG